MERKNMSTLFQPTALVGAIALAMGFSVSVQANTDSSVNASLETLVVTASRSEQKIENVPARISIIQPHILEQSPIAELPHLLMSDASIDMMQYGGYGQTASIFMRGTNSTHTLVLRDGVRLNTGSAGSASLAFIDTTDIKQIEVLKGPASVLYGTDAIGGVVQLVSKTPEKTSAFITGEIGEHNTYKAVLGADLKEDNGIYAQIRAQHLESDGTQVTDFKNSNVKTGEYEQKGFSAKFGIEQKQYAASIDFSQNEGSSIYTDGIFDSTYTNLIGLKNKSQDFKNEIINLKGRVNINDVVSVNARLSQFKDDLSQNEAADFIYNKTQEAELYSKWQFTPRQNIMAGVSHRNTETELLSEGWSTVQYNKDVDSTGYFIQHQYQNNSLSTQVGLRVEDNEKFGTHTVGQVAARYQILPATSIYTNIGTAFRAPTNNDLYALGWGANPELKPEESISYEIGLDQKITNNLTVGLSAYRNEVKDLITYVTDPVTYEGKLFNVKKATFTGAEFNLNWLQDDLLLDLSYAYVQPKDKSNDQDLNRRPRQSLTLTTGLQNEIYGVSTSLSAKSKPKNGSGVTGYATVDVNTYWNINPNIKVFANIQNIGDVQYKNASYGGNYFYVNGGRLASTGVTFRY